MTLINSKFAASLRTKIEQNKNLILRKKRIHKCLEKVHQELNDIMNIINQINKNDDIQEKYNELKFFCIEFDKLWCSSSDIFNTYDNNINNCYHINDDPLNTAFCLDYF